MNKTEQALAHLLNCMSPMSPGPDGPYLQIYPDRIEFVDGEGGSSEFKTAHEAAIALSGLFKFAKKEFKDE